MSLFPKTSRVKTPLLTSFFRWIFQASLATGTDWLVFYLLDYKLEIQYQIAVVIAAICGSIVAFILGRNWTYNNTEASVPDQGLKFFYVVLGSIAMNWLIVTLFVELEWFSENMHAKMLASFFVGVCYNFPMQRYFAFR